ncbi:hypothetical protein A2U01_0087409, partial [Trifolium medium]|nr:hypothetical protein [Trifolium medium]
MTNIIHSRHKQVKDLTDDIIDLLNRELNPMFFTPKDLHPRAG